MRMMVNFRNINFKIWILKTALLAAVLILLTPLTTAAVNDINVDGSPGLLTVTTAVAGSQPQAVSDSSTSYTISTDAGTWQIVGSIDYNMPDYTALKINLPAPDSGSSQGDVVLTDIDKALVTGIGAVNNVTETITYKLSAAVEAGVLSAASRTVIITVLEQ